MISRFSRFFTLSLLVALALATVSAGAHSGNGPPAPVSASGLGSIGGNFEFIDDDGRLGSLADLDGNAILVFFGFTHCPDECPAFLAKTVAVRDRLGELKDRFKVVFVSVDPARDDRETLRNYLALFGDGILGARIPGENLVKVEQQYATVTQKVSDTAGNVVISHSTGAYLVAPSGAMADYVSASRSIAEITEMVLAVLED